MSINRQQRRQAQRDGYAGFDEAEAPGSIGAPGDGHAGPDGLVGAVAASGGGVGVVTGEPRVAAPPAPAGGRVGPRQFLHEVNVEMRKVAWPTRAETLNYSTVVLVSLALIMAFIFGLDLAFSKAASFLFNP